MKTESVMDLTEKVHNKAWSDVIGAKCILKNESLEQTANSFKEDIEAYQKCKEDCKELHGALEELFYALKLNFGDLYSFQGNWPANLKQAGKRADKTLKKL